MRYIIHLLPEAGQRRAFDDLRARLATAIGWNKALDYPTAHVTLIWAIEDEPGAAVPIDADALAALLDAERGHGPLTLTPRRGERIEEHLLLPLTDTPALATLRGRLLEGVRSVAGADHQVARAARIRQQSWPHLTLAQELTPEQWTLASALLAAEGDWPWAPIIGAELSLLARDVAAGAPYAIAHRVPLE